VASDVRWSDLLPEAFSNRLVGRTFQAVLGNGLALGIVVGVAAYSGTAMFGTPGLHPEEGRWPTKEELRKRFSRPANETINELGEGRGKYTETCSEAVSANTPQVSMVLVMRRDGENA